jgi:hypothetical protein
MVYRIPIIIRWCKIRKRRKSILTEKPFLCLTPDGWSLMAV